MLRIGIDVGGTNTDAVLMRDQTVLAGVKSTTTKDVMTGIIDALSQLLEVTGVAAMDVQVVMIGTTHFTNAVVQRRGLAPTAAVRLGLPATECLPPMVDWPEDLRAAIGNHYFLAHGGHEFDGRIISPLDAEELRDIGRRISDLGIGSIAVPSVFSPVNTEFEHQASDILAEVVPHAHITRSCEIGRIGLLERENAAIMNGCLRALSYRVVDAFKGALQQTGLSCPFYLTQNDGTLMDATFAERFPVLTFASGPTNSMRGAAFLSDLREAIVVDVGGTTTDVGALHKGFPRPASVAVEVGGVRTNFRRPDVFSIGLGGGSLVHSPGDRPLTVGPDSVGYRLTTEALVFGGNTLTATDIVVADGRADIGERAKTTEIDAEIVDRAGAEMARMIENVVERMRLSPDPIPVVAVGGGSILVGDTVGRLEVVKPEHFAVANAVGAAIAQVSGEVDRVYALADMSRDAALDDAKKKAIDMSVTAGADRNTVEIVDVEDVPLA